MHVKTQAIVISSVKYQEKGLIVRCLTRSDGPISYFIPNAFSTRKGAPKAAFFQPLTLLELEAVHKNRGSLESIREIRIDQAYQSLQADPVKAALAIFLGEMLHLLLQEHQANDALFDLLQAAFLWLDHHDHAADFHLILLLQITKQIGCYPDFRNTDGSFFDLKDGYFRPMPDVFTVPEEQTALLRRLSGLTFDGVSSGFNGRQRRELLELLVRYFELQVPGFRRPRSLEVLAEVFS